MENGKWQMEILKSMVFPLHLTIFHLPFTISPSPLFLKS